MNKGDVFHSGYIYVISEDEIKTTVIFETDCNKKITAFRTQKYNRKFSDRDEYDIAVDKGCGWIGDHIDMFFDMFSNIVTKTEIYRKYSVVHNFTIDSQGNLIAVAEPEWDTQTVYT